MSLQYLIFIYIYQNLRRSTFHTKIKKWIYLYLEYNLAGPATFSQTSFGILWGKLCNTFKTFFFPNNCFKIYIVYLLIKSFLLRFFPGITAIVMNHYYFYRSLLVLSIITKQEFKQAKLLPASPFVSLADLTDLDSIFESLLFLINLYNLYELRKQVLIQCS